MINIKAVEQIKKEAGADVRIVAATKTVPAETINKLKDYGIVTAGENRVQEFLQKYDKVSGIEWHFIGRLQTNKVKYIIDKVAMIQSVDRPSLADEIEKECAKADRFMDVLLEVNTGENSKGGVLYDDVLRLADYVAAKNHIRVKGLMCIPPAGCGEDVYAELFKLYQKFKSLYHGIEYLSAGMSADYLLAIKNGANMIRPGSAIFGARQTAAE